jgi:hypothetical protein
MLPQQVQHVYYCRRAAAHLQVLFVLKLHITSSYMMMMLATCMLGCSKVQFLQHSTTKEKGAAAKEMQSKNGMLCLAI